MPRFIQARAALAAALLPTLLGCSPREMLVGRHVDRPVAIYVDVSDDVVAGDQQGGVASVVEYVGQGLRERGIESVVLTKADGAPPEPRIELYFQHWNLGNKTGQAIGAAASGIVFVASLGSIDVDCVVYRAGEQTPAFRHHYHQLASNGSDGESIANAVVMDVAR